MTASNRQADYQRILSLLTDRSDAEVVVLSNGTRLIDKLKPRKDGLFSKAYTHELYAALDDAQIDALEQAIGKPIPGALRDFYRIANGLDLFFGSISIHGLRRDYSRNPDIRLPISLEYGNSMDIPADVERFPERAQGVRFGFFAWGDCAELILDAATEEVLMVPRYRMDPVLYTWPSFTLFLESEIERMSAIAKTMAVSPFDTVPPPVLVGVTKQ